MMRSITLATSPLRPPTFAIQEVTKLIHELTEVEVETLQRRRSALTRPHVRDVHAGIGPRFTGFDSVADSIPNYSDRQP